MRVPAHPSAPAASLLPSASGVSRHVEESSMNQCLSVHAYPERPAPAWFAGRTPGPSGRSTLRPSGPPKRPPEPRWPCRADRTSLPAWPAGPRGDVRSRCAPEDPLPSRCITRRRAGRTHGVGGRKAQRRSHRAGGDGQQGGGRSKTSLSPQARLREVRVRVRAKGCIRAPCRDTAGRQRAGPGEPDGEVGGRGGTGGFAAAGVASPRRSAGARV
jgi:hypothetical protein